MILDNTVNRLSVAHSVRAFKQILGLRGKSQEVVSKIESWLNDHRNKFQDGHFEKLKKMNRQVVLLWNQDLGATINRIFLKCLLPDDDSIVESLSPFVNRSMNQEDLEILIEAAKEMPSEDCSSLIRETMRGQDIKDIFFAVHRLNPEARSKAIALTSSLMADNPDITEGYEVARILKTTSKLLPEEEETCKNFALIKIPSKKTRNKALKALRKLPLSQRAVVIDTAIPLLKPYPDDFFGYSYSVINQLTSIPPHNFSRVLKLSMPFIKRIHRVDCSCPRTSGKLIPILRIMKDFQRGESLSLKAVESAACRYTLHDESDLASYLKLMALFPIKEQEKIYPFIAKISEDLDRFAVYLKVFHKIDTSKRLLTLDLLKDYMNGKDSPIVNFAKVLRYRYLWADFSSLPILLLSAFERGPSFYNEFNTKLRAEGKLSNICQAISEIPSSHIDSLIELLKVNPYEDAQYLIEKVREDLTRYDSELLAKAYPQLDLIENDKYKITMMERAKFIPQHRWEDYFRLFHHRGVWLRGFGFPPCLNWKIIFIIHPELKEDCLEFLSSNPEMKKEFLTYLDTKNKSV